MRRIALGAVLLLGLLPGVALAAFPGTNPDESVRLNTPNDPEYDPCEADNEGGATCSSVFEEDYERFGFAPTSTAEHRALQEPGGDRAPAGAEHARRAQPAGADPRRVRRPRVEALDRPARRRDRDPRHRHPLGRGLAAAKIALNAAELPEPQCGEDDCNDDGAFDVDDFADDPRVTETAGHDEATTSSTAST